MERMTPHELQIWAAHFQIEHDEFEKSKRRKR
jgi:hypothetical protein